MVFSSLTFLFVFLPAVLLLFHAVRVELRFPILLCSSLLFYFYGEAFVIWVMAATATVDYVCGRMIASAGGCAPGVRLSANTERSTAQRLWLAVSVVSNLMLLGYFKYSGLLASSVDSLLAMLGGTGPGLGSQMALALPLGISFYTFQSMSYTIDVYRGHVAASRSAVQFATFVTMFPQLVAGPIVRYADIERQLATPRETLDRFGSGVRRFIGGLAKKTLIANPLGAVADRIFDLPGAEMSTTIAWTGLVAYTCQIYFDFSGYSCMAIGLGRMFGFEFPENFRYPYAATSIREFWRRWHISLSTWFRDYVYIPLGGNQHGDAATGRNLLIVFAACGLWHGANWTFLLWGLFHGVFLTLERSAWGRRLARMSLPARHGYVMLVVMVGWVLFRVDSVSGVIAFMSWLLPVQQAGLRSASEFLTMDVLAVFSLAAVAAMPVAPAVMRRLGALTGPPRLAGEVALTAAMAGAFVLSVASLVSGSYNPFIYFRF